MASQIPQNWSLFEFFDENSRAVRNPDEQALGPILAAFTGLFRLSLAVGGVWLVGYHLEGRPGR